MRILNLVLTGGPYAGKTTALENIKKYLKERNIPCVTVPETATELIRNGIIPTKDNAFKFQALVMKRQLEKEKDATLYMAENYQDSEIGVIIYDRGIFDNIAYLSSRDEFLELLRRNHLSEIEALDRYDMVLDLQSLATCKPEEYNRNENNDARMEGVMLAKELDEKTSNAWAAHRNLKVISSKVSLDEETEIILSYVEELIRDVSSTYISRYEIDTASSNLKRYLEKDYVMITERYLDIDYDDYKIKVSRRYKNGKNYILEVFKEYNGKKITIIDEEISDYKITSLLSRFNTRNIVEKKEISFVENGLLYRLYIYDDRVLLEVYRNTKEDEIILPNDLVIKEEEYTDDFDKKRKDQKKLIKLLKD